MVHEYLGVGIAELPLRLGTVYAVFARERVAGQDRLSFPSLAAVTSWLDRAAATASAHGTTLHECYFDAAELRQIVEGIA